MSKKTIVLKDIYLPNMTNLNDILNETQNVITSLYTRFMNEKNYNNLEKSKEALVEYRYIRNAWIIPNGRYVRYIDTHNSQNMILKKGGFVIESNKYAFTLLDTNHGEFKVGKRDRVFFVKLNEDDVIKCNLQKHLI